MPRCESLALAVQYDAAEPVTTLAPIVLHVFALHCCESMKTGSILFVLMTASAAFAVDPIRVDISPPTTVVEREGITGAGWGVVVGDAERRTVELIYPNHPDDFGATAGTGRSRSTDDGKTWTQAPDDQPISGMVDLWQDRKSDGTLVALGIRLLPDPKLRAYPDGGAAPRDAYALGVSRDAGRTWTIGPAAIRYPPESGVVARPLPHIFDDEQGVWLMPAYVWSKAGHRAVLLESADRGSTWNVRSAMATVAAIRESGVQVTTPWLEIAVARTIDGSLQAVVRTGSSEQSPLVTTRSTDDGRTWSRVEKLLAGPEQKIVAGKLPNLLLMPNGILVLLTAHTKLGCRIYISADGTGRAWSDAHVVTMTSGGNTSMVGLDDDTLLVFTPSNKRISCHRVTLVKPTK